MATNPRIAPVERATGRRRPGQRYRRYAMRNLSELGRLDTVAELRR